MKSNMKRREPRERQKWKKMERKQIEDSIMIKFIDRKSSWEPKSYLYQVIGFLTCILFYQFCLDCLIYDLR
jgi:hypothetical protein